MNRSDPATSRTGSDVKFHDVSERGKLDVGWLLNQSISFVDKISELWLIVIRIIQDY